MEDPNQNTLPQHNHPQSDAIHKIIAEARTYEGKDYQKGIDLLDKAKKILPQLDEGKAGSNQTMANNTIDNASAELTYLSKLANLYYNIHQYDQSYELYKKLAEKIPSNPKILKAVGDSLRHLKRYDESIQSYEAGIKICKIIKSFAEFQANIFNSEGLTYIAQEKYDLAASKFEAAINISPKNPLYYCNAGGAYGSKGDRTQALHSYEAAQKLLKENLDEVGLTKDNIKFIDKTLSKFLENLKKLHAIQEDDPTFVSRVNNYGAVLNKSLDSGINNPKDAQGNTPQTEAKRLYNAKEMLQMVRKPQNKQLNRFYCGMRSTLVSSYLSSIIVKDGKVALNTGNMAASIASNLASFLPVIGSQLSTVINFTSTFITTNQITNQASFICKLSPSLDSNQYNGLSQDVVLRLISNNKDYLMTCQPDEYILPAWADSFERAAKWLKEKKEDFQHHLFGTNFDTDMERYGFKLATDLLSKHVATGKIYGSDIPCDVQPDDMIKRLSNAAEDIFKEDRHVQKDRVKAVKEGKVEAPPKEGRKCEIY